MKTQALTLCSLMVLGFTNAFLPPMLNTPATSTTSLTRFAENETMEKPAVTSSTSSESSSEVATKGTGLLKTKVDIDTKTIQISAASVGFFLGFVSLGNPILGFVLASIGAYATTTEGDLGDLTRGVGESTLKALNYIIRINSSYELTDKLGDTYNKAKEGADSDGKITEVEEKVGDVVSKVTTTANELDVVNKGTDLLAKAGETVATVIKKADEFNKENNVTGKISDFVKEKIDN
jgi:hypothetical protein